MKRVFHIAGLLSLLALFAIGCAGPHRVAGAQRSPHYQAVSQRLDLGGELFLYADIEGDVQRGAQWLQGMLTAADKHGADEDEFSLSQIDLVRLSQILGFESLHAVGMSAYREPDGMFLSRTYFHIPDGRQGLMKVSGHEPHPFDVLRLAPASAVLLGDIDLNLRAVIDVLKAMDAEAVIGGESVYDQLEKKLALPLAILQLSPDDMVQRLDTRLMFVLKLNDNIPVQRADEIALLSRFHVLVALDHWGILLEPFLKTNPLPNLLHIFSQGDFDTIAFRTELSPRPELSYLRPVLARERSTGRLFIATDEAFLTECLNGETSIQETSDFAKLSRHIPLESGNALWYVAPQYARWVGDFMSELAEMTEDNAWLLNLGRHMMRGASVTGLSVSRNEPEGIYTVSRSATSLKTSALQTTLILPVMFGTMALFPLGNALEKPGNAPAAPLEMHSEAGANVELCYWAAVRYFEAHGTLPQSVDWTPARLPSSVPYPGDPADWSHPTWRALDFGIHAPHLYQYAFDVHGEAFSCMARGDTDGDGIYTIIERRGFISSDGYIEEDGPLRMRAPQK